MLDVAVALATEVGLDGLSLSQVADRLLISKSALFAHWRNKEELQLATVERAPFENRATGAPRSRKNEAPQDWPDKTLNELQTEGDKTWDLAWVFTGTEMQAYVNGALVFHTELPLGPPNAVPLLIGASGCGQTFVGLIDEARLYNRAGAWR